jgi:hypothetical protein
MVLWTEWQTRNQQWTDDQCIGNKFRAVWKNRPHTSWFKTIQIQTGIQIINFMGIK